MRAAAALFLVAACVAPANPRSAAEVAAGLRDPDEPALRKLAPFLDDPDIGAAALAGFIRSSHPAADRILLERLRATWRPSDSLFAALGARRAHSAVETLLGFAEGGDTAAPARHALAQIGDERAEAVLRAARDDGLEGADDDWRVYCERRDGGVTP